MPAIMRTPLGLGPVVVSLLSGVVLALAFPIPEIWPLVFIGLTPLVWVTRGRGPRSAFIYGFLAGLAHAATLIYWLLDVLVVFGNLHLFLALPVCALLMGYMALYTGLFLLGLDLAEVHLGVRPGSALWIIIGAFLYTGLEYFKGFFLTGFPWEPLGAALCPSLPMIQLSDIVGVGGLTFLVVLVNLALAGLILEFRRSSPGKIVFPLTVTVVVIGLLWGYGHFRLKTVTRLMQDSQQRKVAIIQGAIDQTVKWEPTYLTFTLKTYRDLTWRAVKEEPWLTIWPETAAPFFFMRDPAATEWLQRVVSDTGRPLLFGAPAYKRNGPEVYYYNRANLLDGRGQLLGYYDKVHLVPYGEYVPLKKYFPFLNKITQASGDYRPGRKAKLLDLDGDKIGVLICYESIFPNLARSHVAAGADWLVVMTNDAWFGHSSAPYQHFAQSVLRGVENKRAVFRAANTGISGVILPTGQVTSIMGLDERGILRGGAPALKIKTIYTAVGDVTPQAALGVTLLVFAAGFYRRKQHVARS